MFASRLVKTHWFAVIAARFVVAAACLGMAGFFGTAATPAGATDQRVVTADISSHAIGH